MYLYIAAPSARPSRARPSDAPAPPARLGNGSGGVRVCACACVRASGMGHRGHHMTFAMRASGIEGCPTIWAQGGACGYASVRSGASRHDAARVGIIWLKRVRLVGHDTVDRSLQGM